MRLFVLAVLATVLMLLCHCADRDEGSVPDGDAAVFLDAVGSRDLSYVDSLPGIPCISGSGTHRLYLQGRKADPDQLGRYPILEDRLEIVHGEHSLLSKGSYVEWIAPLCADLAGHVSFYLPNNEDSATIADALWEVFVVHDGVETLIAEARDNEQYGMQGYMPFTADVEGTDPRVQEGDYLLVRVTNFSKGASPSTFWYVVVIFQPPSEYMAWLEVDLQ